MTEQTTRQQKSRRHMLEEFVARKPDDAFSRYGLALECMKSGHSAAAEQHFRALLEHNPSYIPGYQMYGQLLASARRIEEARKVLIAGIAAASKTGNQHARSEMEAAGFVLDSESDVLRNPSDPHTAIVFDPSIRGKTANQ